MITPWLKEEGMTFLKLQREVGGKKGTLLVLPTSRALRGEGEDVRGLLMAREGWKRTCHLGTTSPLPRGAACPSVAVQRIAQDLFSRTQQDQLPPWAGHPHSLAGAVGERAGEGGQGKV